MIATADKDAKKWGMLCHLSALLGLVLVSFGHILGPLLVWLLKRDDHHFIDEQGKESLNFQISMTIYFVVAGLLMFVLIGFFLILILAVANVILVIIASVEAYKGRGYRYPLTIRFIS